MYLEKILLENYRNYEHQPIEFINGINLFIGNNAQGKTNIIESIYFSSMAKSYRTQKDIEVIMFEKDFSRISLEFFDEAQKIEKNIEIYIDAFGRKKILVDEINVKKIQDHIETLPIVLFSPESIDMVRGAPQKRRKFIDMVGSQLSKSYYINLQEYLKCLKLKNSMLKKDVVDREYIYVLHEKMSECIKKIVEYRSNILELLLEKAKVIQKSITGKKEEITLKYESDFLNLNKDQIMEYLNQHLNIDIIRKVSIKGIQKDDFLIKINDIDVSKYGSQGQCRTVLLSLTLSNFEVMKDKKGQSPILLLDDIMSELDNSRIEFLLEYIKNYQSIITTTDIGLLKNNKQIKVSKVLNGGLEI